MDGQAVFKQAVTVLDRSARDVCAEAGVDIAELDWMVPHQANVRILNFLARKLHMPTEKVVITVDSHANTERKSVVEVKGVSVRVELGGRRNIKKKKK